MTGGLLLDLGLGDSADPSTLMRESQQYLCLHSDPFAFLSFSASVHSNLGPDLRDILGHGLPTTQGGSSIIGLNVCWEWGGESQEKRGLENRRRRSEKKSTLGQSSYKCPIRNGGWTQGKGKQRNMKKKPLEKLKDSKEVSILLANLQ